MVLIFIRLLLEMVCAFVMAGILFPCPRYVFVVNRLLLIRLLVALMVAYLHFAIMNHGTLLLIS